MKKSALLLLVTLCISTSLLAQERNTHPPKPEVETKLIILNGNQGWKNTGINLHPGDQVTINATGNVMFSSGNMHSSVGPNGLNQMQYKLNWSGDAESCDDPIKNANHAGLIAEVGRSTFFVGESKKFSGKNGTLYIGINDCTLNGQYKNTGKFKVNIKVVR